MNNYKILEYIKRIKAISETGLLYSLSEYDTDRYKELQNISFELMSMITGKEPEILKNFYLPQKDYPTPKVDIRGLILNEKNEILLVKEKEDGKWSLPGGWAEIGFSPVEVIQKETQEETGYSIKVIRLLAIYDKKFYPHPPQPAYTYKIIFLCEITGGAATDAFDIAGIDYFGINNLPEVSECRILKMQIEQVYNKAITGDMNIHFD
jgi:ADP-ribose pyrophosphatase YjhB (NUDIX family)